MNESNLVLPTRLFSLEPIGMGEVACESLLSYLVRLARAHSTSPRQLIRTEILPIAGLGSGPACGRFYATQARTITGVGKYARAFTLALHDLTGQENLAKLTMLPWADILPSVGFGLTANQVRWCPECLMAQRQEGKENHFLLSWSLECYQVCPTHGRRLASACPWCCRAQHAVPDYPDSHRCTHCRGYLGTMHRNGCEAAIPTVRELNKALLIEAMLADNGDAASWAKHSNLCRRLTALADACTNGQKRALSLRLGLTKTSVSTWIAKQQRPVFPQLLQLCEATGMGVRSLLENVNDEQPPISLVPTSLTVKPRRVLITVEQRQTEHEMVQTLIREDPSTSAAQGAAKIGLTVSQLRYRYRKVQIELSERYRQHRVTCANRRWEKRMATLESVFCTLAAEDQIPSIRKMTERLRRLRLSLQNIRLRRAYREIRVKLNRHSLE